MNKEFIPYEQAVELRELGFDEPCFGWYSSKENNPLRFGICETYLGIETCSKAPLYQQAFRWLLQKHNLYGIIIPTVTMSWTFKTMTIAQGMVEVPPYNHVDACDYSSREEAEQACLIKIIELIKNK
jgi:hypothetical protein